MPNPICGFGIILLIIFAYCFEIIEKRVEEFISSIYNIEAPRHFKILNLAFPEKPFVDFVFHKEIGYYRNTVAIDYGFLDSVGIIAYKANLVWNIIGNHRYLELSSCCTAFFAENKAFSGELFKRN